MQRSNIWCGLHTIRSNIQRCAGNFCGLGKLNYRTAVELSKISCHLHCQTMEMCCCIDFLERCLCILLLCLHTILCKPAGIFESTSLIGDSPVDKWEHTSRSISGALNCYSCKFSLRVKLYLSIVKP